jgi:hypothetical protein
MQSEFLAGLRIAVAEYNAYLDTVYNEYDAMPQDHSIEFDNSFIPPVTEPGKRVIRMLV